MFAWLRAEPARLWRGLVVIREVFGLAAVGALLLIVGLTGWAVVHTRGDYTLIFLLVCLVLAIRAHDLGDEAMPSLLPPALDPEAQKEREAAFLAEQEAARAQVAFLQQRSDAALGGRHEPVEL